MKVVNAWVTVLENAGCAPGLASKIRPRFLVVGAQKSTNMVWLDWRDPSGSQVPTTETR